MAPPGDRSKYGWSIVAVIIGLLIGIATGRLQLNANRCALLNQFGIHPDGCLPDLKPVPGGASSGDFCKPPTISTDAFVTIMNVGYVEAGPSSTEVIAFPPNLTTSLRNLVATPAIPPGGAYTAPIGNIPVATIDVPIVVTVDSTAAITELDENNNVKFGLCRR